MTASRSLKLDFVTRGVHHSASTPTSDLATVDFDGLPAWRPQPLNPWAEWRRNLPHNLIGHLVGYCIVFPFSPRLGHWLHDRTEP